MAVLRTFLFFLGAAALSSIAVLCLWGDIYLFDYDIPEISLTEIVQELVLAGIVAIHFLLAKKHELLRYCNILVGGFFLTMLIRELDAVFDLISHGSWVWFALLATFCAVILPLKHYRQTLAQLTEYTRSPWYGVMLSGLLAVLVFSRLFGMQAMWHAILADGYVRIVKNAVEEGSESFGYMLCLTASIGYYCNFRRMASRNASLANAGV